MNNKKDETLNELCNVFPQHSRETIVYVYNSIVQNVGEEHRPILLSSCIENLLELPDDFIAPHPELPINSFPQENRLPPNDGGNNKQVSSVKTVVVLSDSPLNSPSSSDDELFNPGHPYRNRKRPTYREKDRISSDESLQNSPGNLLFPESDDEMFMMPELEALEKNALAANTKQPLPNILNQTDEKQGKNNYNGHNIWSRKRKLKPFDGCFTTVNNKRRDSRNNFMSFQNSLLKCNGNLDLPKDNSESLKLKMKQIPQTLFQHQTFSGSLTCLSTANHQLFGTNPIVNPIVNPIGNPIVNGSLNQFPFDLTSHCLKRNDSSLSMVPSSSSTPVEPKVFNISTGSLLTPSETVSLNKGTPGFVRTAENIGYTTETVHQKMKTYCSNLTPIPSSNTLPATQSLGGSDTLASVTPNYTKKPVVLKNGTPEFSRAAVKQIVAVIEDVDPDYVQQVIRYQHNNFNLHDFVTNIIEQLLDKKDYPKKSKLKPMKSLPTQVSSSTPTRAKSIHYQRQAVTVLQHKFSKIATKVIRSVFTNCHNDYKSAFKALDDAMKKVLSNECKPSETVIGSFMRGKRNVKLPTTLDVQLQCDIDALKKEAEEGDFNAAAELNVKQYEEEGQAIECGCCYGDATFEEMVQCPEGHLFCAECLRQYSKETVFGSGKLQLFCMTDGCESTFTYTQLQKALPAKIMEKYFERVQDEDLKLANLPNLVRCPSCDVAAVMADGDKVFKCPNPVCLKETCRYCQEDWDDHFGLPCKEVEKKNTRHIRLSYEEKMTKAKARTCWQCKTLFLKSSGCNKMTCRCGAKMCYICRKPKIDYNHFCQHVIEPGEGCKKCNRCFLWTDPTADDDRAVAEIQKEAEKEAKKLSEESCTAVVE